jgi:hypothetical protein
MDIGIIYSEKDPRQTRARDFVREFIRKSGAAATLVEKTADVDSPTLTINGQELINMRQQDRRDMSPMFPALKDIAEALERSLWSL